MRRLGILLLGAVCAIGLAHASRAGEDKKKDSDPVREIDVKGLSFMREAGSAKKPLVIENAEGLKVLEGAKELQERIQKSADFTKEFVLVFAWAGSGGDRIAIGPSTKEKAVFTYTPGLTRDLRHHLKVFAVSKGAAWSVETGKLGLKLKVRDKILD